MLKKIFTLIILIIFASNVYSAVNSITLVTEEYVNKTISVQFKVDADNYPVEINIRSQRDENGINFNVDSNEDHTAIISLDARESFLNPQTNTPTIISNDYDIIIISDKGSNSIEVTMDSIPPIVNSTITVVPNNGNYNNFYSGEIEINFGDSSTIYDEDTEISNHILYLVNVNNLSSYARNPYKKYVFDKTTYSYTLDSIADEIIDGNYYLLIDANDSAGNLATSDNVLATKKNVYFDNTKPKIESFNLGNIINDKIFVGEEAFDFNITLADVSGLDVGNSKLNLILPEGDGHIINRNIEINLTNSSFIISKIYMAERLTGTNVLPGEIYEVSLDVTDKVNNNYKYDFNIVYDGEKPTTPNKNTVTIEDKDKNVTIAWQKDASTDGTGSGIKEYRVYKSSSPFSTISNQTLVCTTDPTATSCKDTDKKENNKTIYYGLVAVDNAGNISDANTQSIWTGPDCDVKINEGDKYTNQATVILKLSYSSDVNAVSFSCNGSSFSNDINIVKDYNFNITSGSGCSNKNEEKTIYVKVKSNKDSRTTICSEKITYDTTAPTVPTNVKATTQSDGSIKLTWSSSSDENSNSKINYRIYYSTRDDVSKSSTFFETQNTNYIHPFNQDTNVYYKLSATDEAGNESELSSLVVGSAKKIGAKLTISITPSNEINGILYVGSGKKTISYKSDETLKSTPQVSVKEGNKAFVSVSTSFDTSTNSGSFDYNFSDSGVGVIKIISQNTKNEQSTSELNFTIDTNIPEYNYNLSQKDSVLTVSIKEYPADIYRVQYLLNEVIDMCVVNENISNFECVFDSINTPDNDYTLNILVYDFALNVSRKNIPITIDNVDEDFVLASALKKELDSNLGYIKNNLELFFKLKIFKITDTEYQVKYDLAHADKLDGDSLFADKNYLEANKRYNSAKELLKDLLDKFPKIEILDTLKTTYSLDENVTVPKDMITDQNIIADSLVLYKDKSVTINRNFEVLKIGENKYFSVTLLLENTSDKEKTLTIVEEIPKSFAHHTDLIAFNDGFFILLKDPVVSFTATIPANSTFETSYRLITPVTDVDSVTKYSSINKNFTAPVILSGDVSKEKIYIKKTISSNVFIYLISIIVLFIVILLIINSITVYKNKKVKVDVKPDSKKEISDYLGNINAENQDNKELKVKTKEVEEKKKKTDSFQENYDYILSAIKRDQK